MHTYLFRSREALLEADEAELIRDVCCDIDNARRKLEKIRARIESLQEYAVAELQSLTEADTKLSAAIVAALALDSGGKERWILNARKNATRSTRPCGPE